MYLETKAVVLYASKYPRGYIVNLYTREMGRISCVANNINSHRSPLRKVLLQPLSLVDITLEIKSTNTLPRLSEGGIEVAYNSIPFDFKKNAIALFLAEFLSLVLREEQQDVPLFDFVHDSLLFFDNYSGLTANFHLVFLLKITCFLGFEPNIENSHFTYFDLEKAHFSDTRPLHCHFLEKNASSFIPQLMRMNYRNMHCYTFSHAERLEVINYILEYYQLHFGQFVALRSLAVLQEVFA